MRKMWDEFVETVNVEFVNELTPELIHRWGDLVLKRHAEGKKSPTYVFHRFGCVSAILNKVRSRVADPNDIDRVKEIVKSLDRPEKRGFKPRPISREDFLKLLETVEGEPKWKAMFLLALNAAMYPGEVAAVKRKTSTSRKERCQWREERPVFHEWLCYGNAL